MLMAVAAALLILGFTNSNPPQTGNGRIGDVKYSVLNPENFVRENGKGWVLMDGRNINNTDLFRLTRLNNIPDGRGVFIRNMNAGRSVAEGDPAGNRAMGSYQADEIKTHTHQYSDAHYAEVNCGNQGLFGNKGESDNDNGRCVTTQTTVASGGPESRPRNIALYAYIKVNN